MKIEIAYNSYTYKFDVKTDDKSFNNEKTGEQCKLIIKENEKNRIEKWFESFLLKLGEDFGHPDLEIAFTSIQYECNNVEEIVSKICLDRDHNWKNITLKPLFIEDKNVLGELQGLINTMLRGKEDTLYKQLEGKKVISKIEEINKHEVSVVVIAPMSAGKSTLINALIGKDLLPSQNKATTATICKIKDVDGKKGFDAVIKNNKGEILDSKQNIDSKYIEGYNNKGNIEDIEIFIEGDIKNIDSSDLKLILVDTPGPNNSENIRHKQVTRNYIEDKKNSLILYVLNATQLRTDDDKSILELISKLLEEENGSKVKERIIFVLNRIDDFKKGDGDLNDIVDECKEYLSGFNIIKPKIFPISAQLAKLTLLNESEVLDEEDVDQLEFLAKTMKRKDTIQISPISQKQKEILYEESKNDKYKASLHYSGLTALQIYIDDYVNNTHKIEVANELIYALKPALENVIIEHNKAYNSSEEEIRKCSEDLEKIVPFVSEEYQDIKKKLSNRINSISADNEKLKMLKQEVNKSFTDIFTNLSKKKVKKQEAIYLLEKSKKKATDLGLRLKTTIQVENDFLFKEIKLEIEGVIETSFKQLVTDAKLSDQNTNMLYNHIQININSTVDKSIYMQKEVETTEVSDSSWYNPFSWGTTKKVDIFHYVEYVDLQSLYNSEFAPLRANLHKKIEEVISSYKLSVSIIKKEGLTKIDEIEKNLKEKINQEKMIKSQIELTESVKKEKMEDLNKMKVYQQTLEIIIN
jgi:signal recognition particle receptor subunit beta